MSPLLGLLEISRVSYNLYYLLPFEHFETLAILMKLKMFFLFIGIFTFIPSILSFTSLRTVLQENHVK